MEKILSIDKSCCGCGGCEQVCPKKCISFQQDQEGFLYPKIEEEKCISCGACVKACPIINKAEYHTPKMILGTKLNNPDRAQKSSSGGVFVPLAEKILEQNGVVAGCAYDSKLTAKHIIVRSKADLFRLQGSKYVQSDNRNIYTEIKQELINGVPVLYTGTGCQVAGLKQFLRKDYDNLFCVDIVCHGVPSPKLFENYIKYISETENASVTEFNFRSKKKGWGLNYEVKIGRSGYVGYGFDDPYYNAFLRCYNYRESCYECKYACFDRVSDITLADFWGIESIAPSFYDKAGVSLVLINTEKGEKLFSSIKEQVVTFETNKEDAVRMNSNLIAPSQRPDIRNTIYNGFDGDLKEYFSERLAVKTSLKTKLKRLIPISLKGKIKYYLRNKN